MQATVFEYDNATGSGSVITDQGVVLPFGLDAMAASGLRHLRSGQRLSITLDGGTEGTGKIVALNLGSIVPD